MSVLQNKFEKIKNILESTNIVLSKEQSWCALFQHILNDDSLVNIYDKFARLEPDLKLINQTNHKIMTLMQDTTEYNYGHIIFSSTLISNTKYFIRGMILNDVLFFDYDDSEYIDTYTNKILDYLLKMNNCAGSIDNNIDNNNTDDKNIDDIIDHIMDASYDDYDIYSMLHNTLLSTFMIGHLVYLQKNYCNEDFGKKTGLYPSFAKDKVFEPKFFTNGFSFKNNELIINNAICLKPYIDDPSLKNKYFGDGDMSFNDLLTSIITMYVPESVVLNCLKKLIPNEFLLEIHQDHELVDIYFYGGNFSNEQLLDLESNKQLVYTSYITISKRLLMKYSKTYNTFIDHDKFLEKIWFINIPCRIQVADCIEKTITNEQTFIHSEYRPEPKFIDTLTTFDDLYDYNSILNYMEVRTM